MIRVGTFHHLWEQRRRFGKFLRWEHLLTVAIHSCTCEIYSCFTLFSMAAFYPSKLFHSLASIQVLETHIIHKRRLVAFINTSVWRLFMKDNKAIDSQLKILHSSWYLDYRNLSNIQSYVLPIWGVTDFINWRNSSLSLVMLH